MRSSRIALLCAGVCAGASAQPARVGVEFQVNAVATGDQEYGALAVGKSGDFIVVWQSLQDGGGFGVFGRRFNSAGSPLASEFQVNAYTLFTQQHASIAVDPTGSFVAAWNSFGQDGYSDGVFARRFNAAGSPLAVEFQVNAYTTQEQYEPVAAVDDDGDFVVVWGSYGQDGSLWGVFARRFTSAGTPLASELQVNSYTSEDQVHPSVAMNGGGAFVVAWESAQGGATTGIFARRFDAAGVVQASEFQVNTVTLGTQTKASVSIDDSGDFVVVWGSVGVSYSIQGQRFDAAGARIATEFQVNRFTLSKHRVPRVAMDADGDFVVAWQSYPQDGSLYGTFAQRFDASGVPEAAEFQVNTYTISNQWYPVVGTDPGGDFVVAWQSLNQDGDAEGVFAQRFAVPKDFDIDGNGTVDPLTDGLLFLRYFFGFRGAALLTGAVAGNCTRCIAAPIESYLASLGVIDLVKAAGPELQVNSYTPGDQLAPAAAMDGDGGFVVAWHSAHEGSSYGVIARRFDSAGVPKAGEFQVNDYVTGFQGEAAVATATNGDFAVVWNSNGQDGSDQGVFARRFSSAGAPLAIELQVNGYTVGRQGEAAVAMNAAGSSVVAWNSADQDGSGLGIFAMRFTSAGTALATEFQVNSYTLGNQKVPAAAMADGGSFVVAWESYGQDGNSGGIFGRRFNNAGIAQSVEFQINSATVGAQYQPAVDMDGAGDFVVAWQADDGSSFGVFARRFDTAGTPQGADLLVNVNTAASQANVGVSVATSGEFVVVWQSQSQDGSDYGIFGRRFNAAGIAQATELQINTYVTGAQTAPILAMRAAGDFVVAWQSAGQDGSAGGVFSRRFAVARAGDVDGDGAVGALTDGLLVVRYLFGFRGTTLISGAVAANCTRCAAPAIESYLAGKV